MRTGGYVSSKGGAVAETDVEFSWQVELLDGGPISKKISYYGCASFGKGDSVKLEDLRIQFGQVFGAPIDVMVGQFQASDPLFKRELRLERQDYRIYKRRVGEAVSGLTYVRGFVFTGPLPANMGWPVQVVDGNGIDPADGEDGLDKDKHKNVALRLVGTAGPARIGGFAFFGKEAGGTGGVNETTWFGPDLSWRIGEKAEWSVQYLERRDDDPFFAGGAGPEFETRGGFVELPLFPKGDDGRRGCARHCDRRDARFVRGRHRVLKIGSDGRKKVADPLAKAFMVPAGPRREVRIDFVGKPGSGDDSTAPFRHEMYAVNRSCRIHGRSRASRSLVSATEGPFGGGDRSRVDSSKTERFRSWRRSHHDQQVKTMGIE